MKLFTYLKEKLNSFYEWKKEDIMAWVLKVLLILLSIMIIIFTYKLLPYILSVLILVLLFFSDSIESFFRQRKLSKQTYTLDQIFCITRNALFRVLYDNCRIFGIIQPKTVSEITPTEYSSLQSINNLAFFRFIVLVENGSEIEKDFFNIKQILNQMISQKLIAHEFEYITYSHWNDIPLIKVINITYDIYNSNYIAFDLMFIDSDEKYQYVKQLEIKEQNQNERPYIPSPKDKDF